jgi:hypothetical protein
MLMLVHRKIVYPDSLPMLLQWKLTETEIKEFTAPITDRRLLKVIDQTNFSYKPQSLQGH